MIFVDAAKNVFELGDEEHVTVYGAPGDRAKGLTA
jgi:hypothetical protein